jgi:sec-independent protein translocase protein TatA
MGLGMGELLLILAIVLLVFGPSKLPSLATGLGKALRSFKSASQGLESPATDVTPAQKPVE